MRRVQVSQRSSNFFSSAPRQQEAHTHCPLLRRHETPNNFKLGTSLLQCWENAAISCCMLSKRLTRVKSKRTVFFQNTRTRYPIA